MLFIPISKNHERNASDKKFGGDTEQIRVAFIGDSITNYIHYTKICEFCQYNLDNLLTFCSNYLFVYVLIERVGKLIGARRGAEAAADAFKSRNCFVNVHTFYKCTKTLRVACASTVNLTRYNLI